MTEIKKGEYVRTDNGEIHKVEDIEDLRIHIKTEKIMFRSWVDDYYGAHKEDRFIVKHSLSIIDLIEEGDYVNGYKVISADYDVIDDKTECIELDLNNNYQYNFISARQIKTIITKEQFENMEYRLED